MNVGLYQKALDRSLGKKQALQERSTEYDQKIEDLTSRLQYIEQAQALIQKVAQETQEQLVYQIEDVVNTALSTCFPDEYTFHIEFKIQRNKTEAKLIFMKNGYEINPMEASGGGVCDVAAFALRIAAWSIGSSDNTLMIDEGFRFLSRDLQPFAASILQEISEKLDLQIIQVSHSPDIIEKSDRIFTVALEKNRSIVSVPQS